MVQGNDTRHGWLASKFDCSMRATEFVRSNYHSSKNMDSFQESVFYLDKSVMDCNLAELVVCYKENTYHVVKDICIDEGVRTKDKLLFDEKLLPSEKDLHAKENPEMDMSINDVSVLAEENQPVEEINNQWGSKTDTCMQDVSLLEDNNESNKGLPSQCDSLSRETKHDAMQMIMDDVSRELYTLGQGELSLMMKTESACSDCKSDGTEQQSFQEVTVSPSLASASEEAILSASDPGKGGSVSEESSSSSCLVNEVSEDGRIDSCAPRSSKGNLDSEPIAKPEDGVDEPFSNNLQRGNGDSSFSLAGPHITYSGPIAYSGNLSLRSDSSTASTRSFAFPILQPEWDTSPVRMAKADRKHRGWRPGILCCRF